MLKTMKHRNAQVYEILAVVELGDDGTYHGYCPALRGLHTWGDSVEGTIEKVKDAAIAYFKSVIKHGDPIPVGPFLKEWTPPAVTEKVITRNILVSVAA